MKEVIFIIIEDNSKKMDKRKILQKHHKYKKASSHVHRGGTSRRFSLYIKKQKIVKALVISYEAKFDNKAHYTYEQPQTLYFLALY